MSRFFSGKYSSLIPYTPGEQPQERKYIKLNTNESPFPPSPIAQRFAREEAGNLQLYSDPECRALVKQAAESFDIGTDRIVFSNGSDDLLNFCFMAFCDAEHPAVFPDITYGFYTVFADLNGVPYEEKPLREDFTIDPEDYIGTGKTVFLANPNAITGIALPLSDIERIVASNPDNVVVIDEAYVDFGGESALQLTKKYNNLIVIQTFSKSRSLAGARLGFCIACPELIRDINTIRYSTNPYNINRMTMFAGVGALIDNDYFIENCEKIKENRAWTTDKLRSMGFYVSDSSSNFILIKHESAKGKDIYLSLKEKGVLVRHFSSEKLDDYNRVTIGSRQQMEDFIEILKTVLEELK